MTAFAIVANRVFDGERIRERCAVLVDGGRIADVVAVDSVPRGTPIRNVKDLLAPGFIDIQVNGGGGVLFNDSPTVEGIRAIGAAHRKFGTTGFLPTLITDTREKMAAAIEAVRQGLAARIPGLLGVHLEGPFLNPRKKGAHDRTYMRRQVRDEDISIMTSLGRGRTLVTVAPERGDVVRSRLISRLAEAGVIVSAGHTMASYENLEKARDQGLRGYTHLFNAMPALESRKPGPVGAALFHGAFFGLIVDFHHVSRPTLSAILSKDRVDRTVLITDAMSVTGTKRRSFTLQKRTIFRKGGRLVMKDGTLAGSDLDMATAVRNVVQLGFRLEHAIEMASLTPAKFLRLDAELGKIAPGYRANLVLLDPSLTVTSTWIDGVEEAVDAVS